MKLVTLTGITKLPAVDIPPQGVSLGRELDNDVVTADEQASRYHAKITMDDGVWRLHDLKSRNGVFVNNKKVEGSAPLSLNDEIRIGRTALRFTDDSGPAPSHPGEGVATPPTDDTSSDGGPATPASKRAQRLRLLGVALVTLVVVLMAAFVYKFLTAPAPQRGSNEPPAPLAAKINDYEIYYEKFAASGDNVFRYEVTLRAGTLHAVKDDIRNQSHEDKELKQLGVDDVEGLFKSMLTSEFLAQGAIPAMPSATGMKRSRLMVRRGREGNYLIVRNVDLPPTAFAVSAAALERFVTDKLRIIDVPLDQRLKIATEKYAEARRLQLEREALPANLWNSIQAYDLVLVLLEGIQDPPAISQDASANRFQAFHDLMAAIKQHESDAQIFEKTNKLADARIEYQKIIDMVPDPSNDNYKLAHEKIVTLGIKISAANKHH